MSMGKTMHKLKTQSCYVYWSLILGEYGNKRQHPVGSELGNISTKVNSGIIGVTL